MAQPWFSVSHETRAKQIHLMAAMRVATTPFSCVLLVSPRPIKMMMPPAQAQGQYSGSVVRTRVRVRVRVRVGLRMQAQAQDQAQAQAQAQPQAQPQAQG